MFPISINYEQRCKDVCVRQHSAVAAVRGLVLCSLRHNVKCFGTDGATIIFLLQVQSETGTSTVAIKCRQKQVLICGGTCRYPNCSILVQSHSTFSHSTVSKAVGSSKSQSTHSLQLQRAGNFGIGKCSFSLAA